MIKNTINQTFKAVNIKTNEGQALPDVLIPWYVTTSYKETEQENKDAQIIQAGRYLRDDLKLTFNNFTLKLANKKEVAEANKANARQEILNMISDYVTKNAPINRDNEPELTIFIKNVSRSGMSRNMIVLFNGRNITFLVNEMLGYSTNNDYIRISGCGMDMAFWLANHITYNLWPYTTKQTGSTPIYQRDRETGKTTDIIDYDQPIYTNIYEKEQAPDWLTGNSGDCLRWLTIY